MTGMSYSDEVRNSRCSVITQSHTFIIFFSIRQKNRAPHETPSLCSKCPQEVKLQSMIIIITFLHHSPLLSLPTKPTNFLSAKLAHSPPSLPSSSINCTFLADIPNQQLLQTQTTSTNVQKSLSHSFLYWLQFFPWQQGQKEIAKLDSKQLSLAGLGREQGVSCLLCLRCSSDATELKPGLVEQ